MKILIPLVLLLAACGGKNPFSEDPKERAVKDGVKWAARTLNRTQHDMASLLSYAATVEQGGSPVTYLAANMPDGAAFTCYEYRSAPKTYCVVIQDGPAEGGFTVQGYGAALDKPIAEETAQLGRPRRGAN